MSGIKKFWDEPDLYEETIEGFLVSARRGYAKAWCGYVRIPWNHPAVERSDSISVHGGVTWDNSSPPWEDKIDPNFFWLGFDCSHSGDLSPKYYYDRNLGLLGMGVYRDLDYVKSEIRSMVQQIKDMEPR